LCGVFYVGPERPGFEENTGVYRDDERPLYERDVDTKKLGVLIDRFKMTG